MKVLPSWIHRQDRMGCVRSLRGKACRHQDACATVCTRQSDGDRGELMRENSNSETVRGGRPAGAALATTTPTNKDAKRAIARLRTTARLTCSRQSLDSRMAGSGWTRWAQGEGAQAYGWGAYFASNDGVAKSYQQSLSADKWRSFLTALKWYAC